MTDDVVDLGVRQRRRRPAPRAVRVPRHDGRADVMAACPPRLAWADDLTDLLRSEVDLAVRRDIITAAEAEQLLARLVLVIDQALAAG